MKTSISVTYDGYTQTLENHQRCYINNLWFHRKNRQYLTKETLGEILINVNMKIHDYSTFTKYIFISWENHQTVL